jgi:hypothetical protein
VSSGSDATTDGGVDVAQDVPMDSRADVPIDASDASDVARDVPTDTPDVIVYSTWDPAWSLSGVAYSTDNLSIATTAVATVHLNARSAIGKMSGRWYWEIEATAGTTADEGGLGVIEGSTPNDIGYIGCGCPGAGLSYGYADGYIYWNWAGASLSSTASPLGTNWAVTAGNRYMFALDMDAGRLWVGLNGTWAAGSNPSTGLNPVITGLTGTVYAGVTFYAPSHDAFTANFGATSFAYPVPTGFHAGLY